ncbi:uncharacterized protein LOC110842573 [Folsomia candida]|uniref:Protein TRC8 n=1 Tax=Folsomia candida TaxID=158441 RepID=A0A226F454_FOLCA|nr:uncharacterized protein LOC110842573 [Folsomia candida]OXA64248.1 Protein TRC8 [Folsomia candida]
MSIINPAVFHQYERLHNHRKKPKDGKYTNNLSILMNQLVFVTLCSRNFLEEEERATSVIYGLLFCHLVTYCVTYVKEIVQRKDWDMSVRIAPNSNVKHLALTSINVGLEWTKAVTFVVTVVCFFLILGAEHGFRLENQPTLKYLCLTLTYYTLTEPRIQGMIPNLMTYLPSLMEKIQGLETLYSAIILRGSTIFLSVCVLIPLLPQFKLVTLTLFTNVYRPWRGLKQMLETLKTELDSIKEFREASPREIEDYEDVCTICLAPMITAKVTPCQHFFHPNCLRLCLKTGESCPVCKRNVYRV